MSCSSGGAEFANPRFRVDAEPLQLTCNRSRFAEAYRYHIFDRSRLHGSVTLAVAFSLPCIRCVCEQMFRGSVSRMFWNPRQTWHHLTRCSRIILQVVRFQSQSRSVEPRQTAAAIIRSLARRIQSCSLAHSRSVPPCTAASASASASVGAHRRPSPDLPLRTAPFPPPPASVTGARPRVPAMRAARPCAAIRPRCRRDSAR